MVSKRTALSEVRVDLGALASNVSDYLGATAEVPDAVGVPDRGGLVPEVGGGGGGGAVVCGVVKKDAYGLGAVAMGGAMRRAGCGMLAVYALEEAEALVGGGLSLDGTCPALVLCPVWGLERRDLMYRAAAANGLHLTLHSLAQARSLDEAGRRLGLSLPVHVHVDTGMSREGMGVGEAWAMWEALLAMRGLRVAGVMSHLATADEDEGPNAGLAEAQDDVFDELLTGLAERSPGGVLPEGVLLHLSNSWAVWRGRRFHRHVVRPGLGLYGYAEPWKNATPGEAPKRGADVEARLRPVVGWRSSLVHVREHEAGVSVGYGATARLERDSTLGVVPVGYGDGYPLGLSNRGLVGVWVPAGEDDPSQSTARDVKRLALAPVVGRVNMDQIVVDLTDARLGMGGSVERLRGCEVEVYASEPNAPHGLSRMAAACESHAYELLCRLGPKLPRVYVGK